MSRLKSNKILIKRGQELYQFMWANVGPDGSVLVGFPVKGKQQVVSVVDEKLGELRPPYIATEDVIGLFKISFHPSGQFKLMAKMGRKTNKIDRVTIDGPKLLDIYDPRRMIEVLLPKEFLFLPADKVTEGDIVLDTTSAPNIPLRCTVSCMSPIKLEEFVRIGRWFVDTSIWEFSNALQTEKHAWIWTLRASKNDKVYADRFYIMLIGTVKWGQ